MTGGGWRRWEQFSTLVEWLPFKMACEALERPRGRNGRGRRSSGRVRDHPPRKGEDSYSRDRDRALLDLSRGPGDVQGLPSTTSTRRSRTASAPTATARMRQTSAYCSSGGAATCVPRATRCSRSSPETSCTRPTRARYCTNCHDPHASEWKGVLVDNQRDLCFVCHPSVAPLSSSRSSTTPSSTTTARAATSRMRQLRCRSCSRNSHRCATMCHPTVQDDFMQASVHPVGTIQLTAPTATTRMRRTTRHLLAARDNELCYECHAEAVGDSRGIVRHYEDSAHVGTLCIDCHTPHGSAYAPILRDAQSGPVSAVSRGGRRSEPAIRSGRRTTMSWPRTG